MSEIFFLGPCGTYCEMCAKKAVKYLNKEYKFTPVSTIGKIIELANNKEDSIAILPIENSIEGIVRPTIDGLYESDLKIEAQLDIKVEHCLISKGKKADIKNIISHQQALAQCRKYIVDNFDENIKLITENSTAAAAYFLFDKDESYGAIASLTLAESLGLNIVDKNIADNLDNKTRFVLVSKTPLNIENKARTSIVFNTKNEPGALLKILKIFNKYNLNLVYLESRPSKKVFGEYNFFVDIDRDEITAKNALDEIQQCCNFYKMLGSYCTIG